MLRLCYCKAVVPVCSDSRSAGEPAVTTVSERFNSCRGRTASQRLAAMHIGLQSFRKRPGTHPATQQLLHTRAPVASTITCTKNMLARGISRQQAAAQRAPGRGRQRPLATASAAAVADRAVLAAPGGAGQPVEFSPLINGCWQLAGGHGRDVFDDIQRKLWTMAEAGYTTFDTADIYGPSEGILGEFNAAWSQAGKPPVQILTKYVPNIFQQRPTPAAVEAAVRRSLSNLQVQQLDLVQLHWWDYGISGMVDVAKSLADLQAKGLIKQVGTTNMNVQALSSIVDAGVPVASNQVQFSLLDRRPLDGGMLQYVSANGIKLLTYGSVAGGLLSDRYVEPAPKQGLFGTTRYKNVDLSTSSLKMYWAVCKKAGGMDWWKELLQVLHGVAEKHGVSVANVALKWVMQQGDGTSVFPIVGMRGIAHIADNVRVLALTLDAEDNAAIDAVLARAKGPDGDCYSFERGG